MHTKRERVSSFIISVLAVVAFLITTVYALIWASGVKVDFHSGTIEHTAVVSIQANLKDVIISLNGQQIGTEAPMDQRNLAPGRYELTISKAGYLTIDKTFQLAADQVGSISSNVVLLAQTPTVEKDVTGLVYRSMDPFDVNLASQVGEIIDNGSLVTRVSGNPIQIHRFNAGYIYQLNDQLRFYFPETNQDISVYQLPNSALAQINLDESNWQVQIFSSGTKADVVHMIEPTAVSTSSK